MSSALIGYTGFVGSNLDRQHSFDKKYNSKNISEIDNQEFDLVVCAGVQAVKWWANQNPEEDWDGIQQMLDHVITIKAKLFVLISTVDIYPCPIGVTEEDDPHDQENHAYGRHRLRVEDCVIQHFPNHLIVRLPGLFGPGLKKNAIFDLINDNGLEKISLGGTLQWYDLKDLWADIEIALKNGLGLVNFAVEPVRTADIVDSFFPDKRETVGTEAGAVPAYDVRSKHAGLWGGPNGYMRDRLAVMHSLGRFIASDLAKGMTDLTESDG